MNNGASFDLAQVATIMTQLLLALDFAHERGVIHRDIKPANLILTASGTLKVADFGIARIDTSSLTSLGMVMGTPSYMSPEQCQGLVVDRRSDLFSAGVVFYELVAGEKPFSGALETIAYKICHEDPRPPSTISRLPLTPTIDAVVATALEKNPEMRFQNAKALARALRQACEAGAEVTDDPYGATQINMAAVKMEPAAVVPAWDDTVLRTVERQLARYVGPMAKTDPAPRRGSNPGCGSAVQHPRREHQRSRAAPGILRRGQTLRRAPRAGVKLSGSTAGQRTRANPVLLEQTFVDTTTSRLATYLGPIARVVANRAAQKASTQDEFVHLVADHLGAQDRGEFLREIGFDS